MKRKITVYWIGLEDEPNNGYYEKNIKNVADAIEALESNSDGFVVRTKKMLEDVYNALPEFMGF